MQQSHGYGESFWRFPVICTDTMRVEQGVSFVFGVYRQEICVIPVVFLFSDVFRQLNVYRRLDKKNIGIKYIFSRYLE